MKDFQKKMKLESVSLAREQGEYANFSSELLTELFHDDQFQDVTLASDDGRLVLAHKVVLSASSSIFKKIILHQPSKQPSPFIFCRGVKYEELQSLLEFIYLGQTSLNSDHVQRFLSVAEDFGIRGIAALSNNLQQNQKPDTDITCDDFQESVFDAVPKKSKISSGEEDSKNDIEKETVPQLESASEEDIKAIGSHLTTAGGGPGTMVSVKKELLESLLSEEKVIRTQEASNSTKVELFEEVNETLEVPTVISIESIENFEIETKPLTSTPKTKVETSPSQKMAGNFKSGIIEKKNTTKDRPMEKRKKKPKKPTTLSFPGLSPKTDNSSLRVSSPSVKANKKENLEKASPKHKEIQQMDANLAKNIKSNTINETTANDQSPEEITIKEETFYAHLDETIVDPKLSKLGKFEKQENGQYNCDICDYSSDNRKHVFVHKMSKHVKLKFECDVCENIFTDPRSLKKHKVHAHEDVRYECDLCERTTSTAYHLASHKRRKHST